VSPTAPRARLTLADAPDALNVAMAAALLGISEGLCRREIAAGKIPAVWFGRIVRVPKTAVARMLGAGE
jgi:excisionase family DNA binding protein